MVVINRETLFDLCVTRDLAAILGVKFSAWATLSIRSRVSLLNPGLLLIARETVEGDKFTSFAMSFSVIFFSVKIHSEDFHGFHPFQIYYY